MREPLRPINHRAHYDPFGEFDRRGVNAAKGCFGAALFLYLIYLLVVVGIVVGLFFLVWKAVLG